MTNARYIESKVSLSETQKQKIANAYKNKSKVSINFKPEHVGGEESFFFTRSQITRMNKAFKQNKGVNLLLSFAQVSYNAKHGGFLGALLSAARAAAPFVLPIAKKVLPALGLGALSGLAEGATKKIFGNGLYLRKNGSTAQVETDGEGLYLRPIEGNGLGAVGDGLFLVTQGRVQRGEGFLSNIPLIGPLLKSII